MKYRANPVVVDAFRIEAIDAPSSNGSRLIRHEAGQMLAHGELLSRIDPVPGDYVVVQEDGYTYLNPREVFERKYSPIAIAPAAPSKPASPLDPNQGNPFEPPETASQQDRRVGRMIREAVDARALREPTS